MVAEKKELKLPRVLICLGRALEVDGENLKYSWTVKDRVTLCAVPSGQTLYCVAIKSLPQAPKRALERLLNERAKEIETGCDLYEQWNDFEAAQGLVVRSKRGSLHCVDRCKSIVYESDKWTGRNQRYIHTFRKEPKVWVNNKTKPTVLVLSGGKITTTNEGIRG